MDWIQQYWTEMLFAAIISVCTVSVKYVYKAVCAVKGGMQAILRDEIIALYNRCSDNGCVKIYELENMEHLYINYKALGGNGAVEELYEDFKRIQIYKRMEENEKRE